MNLRIGQRALHPTPALILYITGVATIAEDRTRDGINVLSASLTCVWCPRRLCPRPVCHVTSHTTALVARSAWRSRGTNPVMLLRCIAHCRGASGSAFNKVKRFPLQAPSLVLFAREARRRQPETDPASSARSPGVRGHRVNVAPRAWLVIRIHHKWD